MPDLRVRPRHLPGGGDGAGATRTHFTGIVDVEPRTRGPLRVPVLSERLASAGTTCSPRQTVIQDDAAATCGPLQVSIPLCINVPSNSKPTGNTLVQPRIRRLRKVVSSIGRYLSILLILLAHQIGYTVRNPRRVSPQLFKVCPGGYR